MATVLKREVPEWKKKKVNELVEVLDSYDVVAIADLFKVRAVQLQNLRKKFQNDPLIRVAKNLQTKLALKRSKKPGVGKLSEMIQGSSVLILTNMNPLKLSLLLYKSKINVAAKAGDTVQNDITLKAGNTGLPPGPAISEFRDLGVKTKIELGSIFIVSNTVVAKRGDTVTPKLASMLSKLGVKPLEVGLSLKAAYYNGSILTEEQLHVDVDSIIDDLVTARNNAFNLTFVIAYPTKENIVLLLRKASSEAKALALNSAYPTTETIHAILAMAHAHGVSLLQKVEVVSGKKASQEKT